MSDAAIADRIYPGAAPAAEPAAPAAPAVDPAAAPAAEGGEATLLTEKPAEEGETKEAAAPEPVPFDAEKLTFPEGVKPDPATFGEFTKIAESHKLSLPAAQEFLDLYNKVAGADANRNADAWKTTREGWVAEVKGHPEIGGNNLTGVVREIKRVILDNPEFAHPKLLELLETTATGDALPLIYTFHKLAKALGEGTYVGGNAPSRQSPRSLAEVMYPNLSAER